MNKAYVVAMAIQVILASTIILSKVAFDRGLSTYVFVFYRLAAASLFLLPPAAILVARLIFKCFLRSVLFSDRSIDPFACKHVLVIIYLLYNPI